MFFFYLSVKNKFYNAKMLCKGVIYDLLTFLQLYVYKDVISDMRAKLSELFRHVLTRLKYKTLL